LVRGVQNKTNQVKDVNQIERSGNASGDAPASCSENRGAQGAGGQPPSYAEYAEYCSMLTDKELDALLISGNPLGQICLDLEIIDEVLEEQENENERIEKEIRKAIEEADYEKEKTRLDALALAETPGW